MITDTRYSLTRAREDFCILSNNEKKKINRRCEEAVFTARLEMKHEIKKENFRHQQRISMLKPVKERAKSAQYYLIKNEPLNQEAINSAMEDMDSIMDEINAENAFHMDNVAEIEVRYNEKIKTIRIECDKALKLESDNLMGKLNELDYRMNVLILRGGDGHDTEK